ncbi:ArpU family phage packaging/lysis transcriptional regulator [Enterococcus faecalis]|uniref:ArpU family phage packaging/lysis transcriptional regulator n=1 Tax=Enterococcus faecalis TaxID=1351 RepID=UPI004041189E
MNLVPEIDVKQTRDNARRVLKSCRTLQRRSGIVVSLESPLLSNMPRYRSNRNNVEHSMIKWLGNVNKFYINENKKFREILQAIDTALKSLSEVSRKILYYSYCVADPYSMAKLSTIIKVYRENEFGQVEEITYSIKNVEKLKNNALIEFAEAYHYENLIVQKK